MSISRKIIVGVVGGSGEPDMLQGNWDSVLHHSRQIGQLIAQSGNVLLTGGVPALNRKSMRVNENAMSAAIAANGLAIGILPKTSNQTSAQILTSENVMTVKTMLSSHKRNIINGTTPDVIIALPGGPGTVSEVQFALTIDTPVIFLNSISTLSAQDATKVARIVSRAIEENPTLEISLWKKRLSGIEHSNAADAVQTALFAVKSLPYHTNYLAGLRGTPEKTKFEAEFQNLCAPPSI